MSLLLSAASSQSLVLQASIFSRPCTFGCWYRTPNTADRRMITGIYETTGNTGFSLNVADTEAIVLQRFNGTSSGNAITLSSVAGSARWSYVVARHIATNNRRLATLTRAGTQHGSNTSQLTQTITHIAIGRFVPGREDFFEGEIAEWFYADADVQPAGGDLTDDLLYQLAYYGPFSLPHLAPSIVEYKSLRHGPYGGFTGDTYQRGGPREWTVNNSPTIGEHPPLPGGYVRPNQNRIILSV